MTKWKKTQNSKVWVYHGEKYTYAYSKLDRKWTLLLETISIPPAESIRITMNVVNPTTAKQIVAALEKA